MPPISDKRKSDTAPLLQNKSPQAASVFSPDALLREARRQKGLAPFDVPAVCIFDPDGDILRHLRKSGRATRFDAWPCYHTELYTFRLGERDGRHRRLRRRRTFRRLDRRRIIRLRLPLSAQPDLGRTNQSCRADAVFRGDRPCAPRRGNQLSLRRARRVRRSRRAARRDRCQRFETGGLAHSDRGKLDHGCAISRNRRSNRGRHARKACWRWKWRRPRFIRSRGHAANPCCASRMSPTRWGRPNGILKKASPMEQSMR